MRRAFLIFLMFLLPLQSSWAALNTCICDEERVGFAAAVFAPHVERIGGTDSEIEHEVPCDPLCSSCQLGHAQAAVSIVEAIQEPLHARPPALQQPALATHIPPGPERPKWLLAASIRQAGLVTQS